MALSANCTELYNAVMEGNENKVIELCRKCPEGPLSIITIHKDTVLHMAAYTEQADLVHHLIDALPDDRLSEMVKAVNNVGNTILHEAATSNKLVEAAREMLSRAAELAPSLLSKQNEYYETALFRAVRYGKSTMFKFLDGEIKKNFTGEEAQEKFYRKEDKTNMLHVATIAAHFDSSIWRFPWWEAVRKEVKRYDSALKLAKLLIEKDTSWKDTGDLVEDRIGGEASSSSDPSHKEKSSESNKNYTPLLLATKHGSIEIVREILKIYPQAVEHVDDKGRTILHLAIKYRQLEILDMMEEKIISMKRLVRKCDKKNNSILHMVGLKAKSGWIDDTRSPALQLQEEWLLFERVQNICSVHFFRHININGRTAEQVFANKNNKLRREAKEWLKRTAENSSIVAVLIATVAFAAAYTVPGGSDQNTGAPILLNQTFFIIFTITDVLSLTFALTSVIIFLSILTSPFRLIDFKQSLPQKLMLGFTCLIFSVSMMMLAFAATIILVIHNKGEWTKVALYTAAFLPVCVFAFSYLPLYSSLLRTLKYSLNKIVAIFSPFNNFFKSCKSRPAIPSSPA
ncbi:hypothetical protein F0562_008389 [Nyssa sinensis]|uniref:PGG domain-containing protein n=1 Tax=Nyssa sinensis TaxID=561372 RepID=A0A5J5A8R5_9ASTE|nr:hypothetical protein F0562_008389 [Nyssa sinensis]